MTDLAIALVCAVISALLFTWSHVIRAERATCPAGWYVNGVAPDGTFRVRPVPPPERPCASGPNGCIERDLDIEIRGRIYCTGGARPVVVNERTVGCQR